MIGGKQKTRGQSAIELALLLPILAVLIGVFITLHNEVTKVNNQAQGHHLKKKQDYRERNMIYDSILGEMVPAETPGNLLSNPDLITFGDLAEVSAQTAAQAGANRVLDLMFSQLDFFNTGNIIPDAVMAFTYSAINSYIDSGYTEVDWEGATWDGATAGLSSNQATEWFQGDSPGGRSVREFLGSGAQQAALSYTASQGDEEALLTGFVDGLFSSDSFGSWTTHSRNSDGSLEVRDGGNAIVVSAAAGAISATATGLAQGEFDLRAVAQATASGAIQNNGMAELFTGSNYQGNPAGSAAYSAFSGVTSTLIGGGSVQDAAFAGANRAFYSQQVQGGLQSSQLGSAAASIAFESGVSLAQGNSIDSVGQSALAGAFNYAQSAATAAIKTQATSQVQNQFSQSINNISLAQDLENHPNSISDEDIVNYFSDSGFGFTSLTQEQYTDSLIQAVMEQARNGGGP